MTKKAIKILAIDDHADNLVVLKALVNDSFPEAVFIAADSGRKGYELCQAENPDVILLDIVMPGMDGYVVCNKLKADIRLKHIPVIMITANRTDKESRVRALEAGADAFLPKPVDISELKAQIKAMLRIKEAEDLKKAEKQHLEDMVLDRTEALEMELADRKKAEKKLILSLEKITRNKQAILNLMEDLKSEINERTLVEKNLQYERNLLRTLIDNLPDTIYFFDTGCRKIIANKADVEVIGYDKEADVLGKTDLEMYPGEIGKRFYAQSMNVINTGIPKIDYEEKFIDKKGRIRFLNTSQIPLYDAGGKIMGLVGIGHDITKRKFAEQELIKSRDKAEESDRLKTAFLHNISHEIRTPMNAIIGFSAMLGEPDLDKESQNSYVEIITQSSNHLLSIVSDIIEISNIEAGILKINLKRANLNTIFNTLHRQFLHKTIEKNIAFGIFTALSDSEAEINTDDNKLILVLSRLLSNAVKFTAAGRIDMGYIVKDDFIEFRISDTGIGIPDDQHNRIFERFYQVENSITRLYEGTGLGLSISKAYVEVMGGKIWVTSEQGIGSVFYFSIPYLSTDLPFQKKNVLSINPKVKDYRKKTVLIAEDEENNYRLMVELLAKLDLNLIHASNGKEAVEICNSNNDIDLIIMDIKMPVMDGYEATGIIKKLHPAIPVIAQTAFSFESDRENVLSAGCDDYISKPLKRDVLIELVKKYL